MKVKGKKESRFLFWQINKDINQQNNCFSKASWQTKLRNREMTRRQRQKEKKKRKKEKTRKQIQNVKKYRRYLKFKQLFHLTNKIHMKRVFLNRYHIIAKNWLYSVVKFQSRIQYQYKEIVNKAFIRIVVHSTFLLLLYIHSFFSFSQRPQDVLAHDCNQKLWPCFFQRKRSSQLDHVRLNPYLNCNAVHNTSMSEVVLRLTSCNRLLMPYQPLVPWKDPIYPCITSTAPKLPAPYKAWRTSAGTSLLEPSITAKC